MNNLRFYALQDTNTGVISMFSTCVSDEAAVNFYVQNINQIYKGIIKNERTKFLKAVHNSKIVRLADIDCAKPDIVKNLAFIADLNELVINDSNDEKK